MNQTMTKKYETGISANYLQHWNNVAVLKEFIQNAVFAKDILGDSADFDYVDGKAIIKNYPSGFGKGDLLIGESQQRNYENSPGFYGEGQKMAMLVATRQGLHCHIQTNGFDVTPYVEPSELNPEVSVLKFGITDTNKHEGTIVTIECAEYEFHTAMEHFLSLSEHSDTADIEHNTILFSPHMAGDLYVNGVRVVQDRYHWGYNLTNREVMNRDRSTVNQQEVEKTLGLLIGEAPISRCVELLKVLPDGVKESQVCPAFPQGTTINEFDKWANALRKVYGKKIALATGTSADIQAEYRKYKLLSRTELPNEWYSFFRYLVPGILTSEQVLMKEPIKRVHRKPSKEYTAVLGWAKRLIKLYYADYGTVKIAENLTDEHGNPCYGLYDRTTDVIWLDSFILTSKKQTFTTLLHEVIHKVTGANDNTHEFTLAWEDASYKILMRGKDDE